MQGAGRNPCRPAIAHTSTGRQREHARNQPWNPNTPTMQTKRTATSSRARPWITGKTFSRQKSEQVTRWIHLNKAHTRSALVSEYRWHNPPKVTYMDLHPKKEIFGVAPPPLKHSETTTAFIFQEWLGSQNRLTHQRTQPSIHAMAKQRVAGFA